MKMLVQVNIFLALLFTSLMANAGTPIPSTPEIGMGSAALGLGLVAGFVAIISERRGK